MAGGHQAAMQSHLPPDTNTMSLNFMFINLLAFFPYIPGTP